MKFFLDTANLDELRKGASWGIVDGVTTNPSLIAKEGNPIQEQIRKIVEIVDGDISAEVVSVEADEMIREGLELAKIHPNIVVKCPLIREGIKAPRLFRRRASASTSRSALPLRRLFWRPKRALTSSVLFLADSTTSRRKAWI